MGKRRKTTEKNQYRALRGEAAIDARLKMTGEPKGSPEEDAIDVITDLCHYCHQNGVDYAAVIRMSRENFLAELEGE